MKKILLLLLLAFPLAVFSQAAVLDRLRQKVKNRVDQKVDAGMDKSLDKAEGELTGRTPAKNVTEEDAEKSIPPAAATPAGLRSYSRFDFVPGERVVYTEDFSADVIGELPIGWTTNNRGETVTVETFTSKWFRLFPGQVVSPEVKGLPENFTVEYDMLLTYGRAGQTDFGPSFPRLELQLLQLAPGSESARRAAQNGHGAAKVAIALQPAYGERSTAYIQSYAAGGMFFEGGNKELRTFSDHYRKSFHVALWVQKQRLRLWINGEKIYDLPQALAPRLQFTHLGFKMADISDEDNVGVYVTSIKVAEGAADLRSKLLGEGKFSTHGITFEVASDRVRPESYGVVKEIATLLTETPTLRLKIVGHTDSDGTATANLELSRRRAAAVKDLLVKEFGITAARMETDGKGASQPLAGNATREGKAANRRVEFTRL